MDSESRTALDGELGGREKVERLYEFLGALSNLRSKTVRDIDRQPWKLYPETEIPGGFDCVSMSYPDHVEDGVTGNGILLSITKPDLPRCPDPGAKLVGWLEDGWDNPSRKAAHVSRRYVRGGAGSKPIYEIFEEDASRVKSYRTWLGKRDLWADESKELIKIREVFSRLFEIHSGLRRDSESNELMVGNGFLRVRDTEIDHPILLHHVDIQFDADTNTIRLVDTGEDSELYKDLLIELRDIRQDMLPKLEEQMLFEDCHPLDRNDTPIFLRGFIRTLSAHSEFSLGSEKAFEDSTSEMRIYMRPVFFMRAKPDGTRRALRRVVEDIEAGGDIPEHLINIVSGGTADPVENAAPESIERQLAAVGGEDPEILLSKMANREQLEIARRIGRHNAVTVQGPPGTGKTHTIANLIGNFLAQGKTVLVTSQTTKALTVLKEKIDPSLQDLCVSVLDRTNDDLEKSIDGINSRLSYDTSDRMSRKVGNLEKERGEVIRKLAETRRRIFELLNEEYESIVIAGEAVAPAAAARYVAEHAQSLSDMIPGKIAIGKPLPLTGEELRKLYHSNTAISASEESELRYGVPDPALMLQPSDFDSILDSIDNGRKKIAQIAHVGGLVVSWDEKLVGGTIKLGDNQIAIELTDADRFGDLKELTGGYGGYERWMVEAASAGKQGGSRMEAWKSLISLIELAAECADRTLAVRLGHSVDFADTGFEDVEGTFGAARESFKKNGKVRRLDFALNKKLDKDVFERVLVDGHVAQSSGDCDTVLGENSLREARRKAASFWSTLMSSYGAPEYRALDAASPEGVALKWCTTIRRMLSWNSEERPKLVAALTEAGIDAKRLLGINDFSSDAESLARLFSGLHEVVPRVIEICETAIGVRNAGSLLESTMGELQSGRRSISSLCRRAQAAIANRDAAAYAEAFEGMAKVFAKRELKAEREGLLLKVKAVAPLWAEAIRTRSGIHGSSTPPSEIEAAWKWLQYHEVLDAMHAKSISELQEQAAKLSRDYRASTAALAEGKAWYELLKRTENNIDMRQALNGWKLLNKKIGKGTGKRAPQLRAEARRQMAKCQEAVPVWIMPMSRALDSFDPQKNRFDVVIVDEASQSNVTALAILYYAKKAIVVGDDRQVSPITVGVEKDQMQALINTHIAGVIPNSQLYDSETSLYDIAASTFTPLMLHEHFRCVPDIIGYSNWLSYDGKIKPLREASSSRLIPAVVPYRVAGGERAGKGKVNNREAAEIVALMRACFDQPEYDGKTFGVISLLGQEQAKKITEIAYAEIRPRDLERRRFLCGDAANFQGDERDVIFLSMVDSGNQNGGPLHLDRTDMRKKRFNVAASRAKDQLWVVYSLDPGNDLKEGDLRRGLIDYARDPGAYSRRFDDVERLAESPFEEEVAKALVSRGFDIVQQWEVGAYRIDMVAIDGRRRIAIECDGERWHSGQEKIREDMERQAILERLGWEFIRIRGSEYYEDKEAAISRVCAELEKLGIHQTGGVSVPTSGIRGSELLDRVRARAAQLLGTTGDAAAASADVAETTRFALSSDAFESMTKGRGTTVTDADDAGGSPDAIAYGAVDGATRGLKTQSVHSQAHMDGERRSSAGTSGSTFESSARSQSDSLAFLDLERAMKTPGVRNRGSDHDQAQKNEAQRASKSQWSDLQSEMEKLHTRRTAGSTTNVDSGKARSKKPRDGDSGAGKPGQQDDARDERQSTRSPLTARPATPANSSDSKSNDLATLASSMGLAFVDNRAKGGVFFIVGDRSIAAKINDISTRTGCKFTYLVHGSKRNTDGKPAWWTFGSNGRNSGRGAKGDQVASTRNTMPAARKTSAPAASAKRKAAGKGKGAAKGASGTVEPVRFTETLPLAACYRRWKRNGLSRLNSHAANLKLEEYGLLKGKPGAWEPSDAAVELGCYYGEATTQSGKEYETVFLSPQAQARAYGVLKRFFA